MISDFHDYILVFHGHILLFHGDSVNHNQMFDIIQS